MINVKISQDDKFHLEMKGHADYHKGNDIVCAGASAIVYALMGFIENFADSDIFCAPGEVVLTASGDVRDVFIMAWLGLKQIEQAYPKNLHIVGGIE